MISVIIPLGALLIAILSVAALWLWWTGDAPPELASEQSGSMTSYMDSTPPPVAQISSAPTQSISAPTSDEVLRVVRNSDGQLNILMNGNTYRSMADVS